MTRTAPCLRHSTFLLVVARDCRIPWCSPGSLRRSFWNTCSRVSNRPTVHPWAEISFLGAPRTDPELISKGRKPLLQNCTDIFQRINNSFTFMHHLFSSHLVPSAQGMCWVRQPFSSPPAVVHHNREQGGCRWEKEEKTTSD